MRYRILPFLAIVALSFSACDKDEEVSKNIEKERLMSKDWKYQDVLVVQDISYSMWGMKMDFDTTYSPFKDTPPCELDFTIQFLADQKYDYTLLDTYCGEDMVQSQDSRWDLDEAKAEFTLMGYGMAGMLSMDGATPVSLGDTAIYNVIELTDKTFIFEYVMDQAAMMESLGMSEYYEMFDMDVEGDSKIRISLVSE